MHRSRLLLELLLGDSLILFIVHETATVRSWLDHAVIEATETTMTWFESAAKRARDRVVSTGVSREEHSRDCPGAVSAAMRPVGVVVILIDA
jgi:hypothetical protein